MPRGRPLWMVGLGRTSRTATGAMVLLTLLLGQPTVATAQNIAKPAGNGYLSSKIRLPKWQPQWSMPLSTIVMPCNDSGYHSVDEASAYGLVSYDWSNAKQLWCNSQPMDDGERLVAQAEMVRKASNTTRIGVYRNSIKALNWFTEVREKLDDPAFAGWFIKFKDYQGPASNHSYAPAVPACTFEKCSGFYHDQEQSPAHPHGDGSCIEECDCGKNPCGEYIFDHRNASFADWFVNEYIVSNSTILHPAITELYLDDRMETFGVSEEDGHFWNDTGLGPPNSPIMKALTAAFTQNMERLYDHIVEVGGFAWQMFQAGPYQLMPTYFPNATVNPTKLYDTTACMKLLRERYCVENGTHMNQALVYTGNSKWSSQNITGPTQAEQYLSTFLLTRGPFAWIGYDWKNCMSGCNANHDWPAGPCRSYPRPAQWDEDYGAPVAEHCTETIPNSSANFARQWTKASVEWNCNTGVGTITRNLPKTALPLKSDDGLSDDTWQTGVAQKTDGKSAICTF